MPPVASAPFWQQFSAWASRSPEYARLCTRHVGDLAELWRLTLERHVIGGAPAHAACASGDRRFTGESWSREPFFDYLHQAYLINARFLQQVAEAAELSPKEKGQLRFFMRQFVDAAAPSNFLATNPDALQQALASNGETLKRGLENLVEDLAKGRVATVDESVFEVGRNLGATPGAVIFENELIQLIQYRPAGAQVHERPLLMVPPCINKFYILDLGPESSFVRHALEAGHNVFMVSWRNPDATLATATWDDYIERGVIAALDAVMRATRAKRVNLLGFCVGGTLLATALAVLAARKRHVAASLTLLATLLDFGDTGEIGCFVTEETVVQREATLGQGGLLSGRELAFVFSALRDNDLIWSYVVNNYLKGGRPAAFDILYWNADSTNLPGPMFTWYLRNAYLENKLKQPRALEICGARIDLRRIDVPTYIAATREDHIVPWRSAYASTRLLGGEIRFVLGASGHVAGIINPAAANRRSFWFGALLPDDPDAWFAGAQERRGSWWPDWSEWLQQRAGARKPRPRALGGGGLKAIEPAPGRYVKERIA